MSLVRAIGHTLLTSLVLALAVGLAGGCDDPAPNRPAPSLVQETATSQSAASAPASAAPSASTMAEAAPVDSAAPAPTPVAEGPAPTPPGSASGSPAAGPAPAPRKGSARTGILKAEESDKIHPAGSPARVVLLDAGAEPRSPARYAFATGASTGLEMSIAMTLEVAQGERAVPPQKIPRIMTLLDLATASAAKDGALGIDATVKKVSMAEDAGVPKQIAERLLPLLKGVEGMGLHYEVTPTGRVKQAGAKLPAGQKANPALDGTLSQMTQSFESMIATFPEEPIGIGARWEVVSRFASSGTELLQWSTFQLEERDDEGAKLGLEVVQAAAKPEMTPPGAPAGFTAKVVDFASKGAGATFVEFTSPAPRKATVTVESKMALEVGQPGAPGGGTMAMKSNVVVEMKRAGAAKKGADKKPAGKTPAAPAPAPAAP